MALKVDASFEDGFLCLLNDPRWPITSVSASRSNRLANAGGVRRAGPRSERATRSRDSRTGPGDRAGFSPRRLLIGVRLTR